jgi:hypothetical protein
MHHIALTHSNGELLKLHDHMLEQLECVTENHLAEQERQQSLGAPVNEETTSRVRRGDVELEYLQR